MAESAIGYFNVLAPHVAPEGKDRSRPEIFLCVAITASREQRAGAVASYLT